LAELLRENPHLLLDIPCDEIENWQEVAQRDVPQSVLDRLVQDIPGLEIQHLEDAEGVSVNIDYFSVTFPASSIPGGLSPNQFLDQIRTNINDYIDGSTFEFYPGLSDEDSLVRP